MKSVLRSQPARLLPLLLVLAGLLAGRASAQPQVIDAWRADDLNLFDDGDAIGSWSSIARRPALNISSGQPILHKNATPGGSSAMRFDRNWMTVSSSPVAGLTSFSIALVFKASAVGTNAATQWYGKSGILDADQSGTAPDWGLVIDEKGRLAFGSGQPDVTTTGTGTSLVDNNYHIAVASWGGGAQAVYLDDRAASFRASGASAIARSDAGFSIGAIHSGDTALGRRFAGELAEIRFYGRSLTGAEATNVIQELRTAHILPNLPVVRLFTAATNSLYVGDTTTLRWEVTNATGVAISPVAASVSPDAGTLTVTPSDTTTYILTATNAVGTRTATLTVYVDPGIPTANPQSVVTIRNSSRGFHLTGSDPNGGTLTYAVRTPPAHGQLTGTAPDLVYAPAPDYSGSDSFTFVVNDGAHDSSPATVSIRIDPLPTAPSRIVLSTTNLVFPTAAGTIVSALRTVDANPLDTHTYAFVTGAGSRDNALFQIAGNQLRTAAPLTADTPTNLFLRVRTTDSAGLTLDQPLVLQVGPDTSHVVINEIHYNGANNTVPEEFIELFNPRETPQELSGWRIRGGVNFVFPPGTLLQPHGFLVIAEDPATLLRVYSVSALGPWTGGLNNEGEEVSLRDALDQVVDRVQFQSEFPWPVGANGGGGSMELINPGLDNNLGSSWRTPLDPALPSPGATNRSFALNAPPNQRQVDHSPQSPASTDPVRITVKVTDPEGVASVVLEYQVLPPGGYVPSFIPWTIAQLNAAPLKDPAHNPAYDANWVAVPMLDDGQGDDAVAGDDIYTVTLPPQVNRTLVRYRITATDTFGASRRAPFEDDTSLNFAYFVYDGIPDYFGTPSATLQSLPVYFLITRAKDLLDCNGYDGLPQIDQFNGSVANEARYAFNWPAAIVYDGEVYDNIRYRLRGANGRYQPGKRNMRFKFNDGHHFQARDLFGKPYPVKWASLTTGKGSSNRLTLTYGLNEVLNYYLWNKVGVPAPMAHWFHFRVVQGVDESPDAYHGDFWGLSWAQENYDVGFLNAHNLAKGNLYKLINAPRSDDILVDQQRQERYQGPYAVTNGADAYNIQQFLNATQTSDWLLSYVNYSNWFRFHAVAEAVRHYDYWPSANKNAAWYFEPIYTDKNKFLGRMWTFPWDTDSTWGPTWNSGFDAPYNGIFATEGGGTQKPELIAEYRNVVREVRDLLFQPDQLMPVIDAFAARIRDFVPADLQRWSNAPTASNPKAISEAAYRSLSDPGPGLTGGVPGYAADLKKFAFVGGSWPGGDVAAGGQTAYMDTVAADTAIPTRPTVTYLGTPGYALDQLFFRSSDFADPQGAGTFGALRWRVAEVQSTNTPVASPADLRLEWDAVWDSGVLTPFKSDVQVPGVYLEAGHRYRIRVRHMDLTGRWSRWSAPLEFIPTPAEVVGSIGTDLVVSELMYHPAAPGEADEDAYEFLEFKNIGATSLDLTGITLSGVGYTFPDGMHLAPGAIWLLVRDLAAFQRRYPGVTVNGVYGGKLDNGGETIAWSLPWGDPLGSLTYGDRTPWPAAADGLGFSLVLDDPALRTYRASTQPNGSPGQDDPPSSIPPVVINEILASSLSPSGDAVELHNPTGHDVDVSGWWLTDDPGLPQKFKLPPGSIIPAGGYLTFNEAQFNPQPGTVTSFALSALGEELYLFSASPAGALTGYSHGVKFGGSAAGQTLGRYVNAAGEESFPPQAVPSLNALNSGPAIGPVVISEIHYHPQSNTDEFLELLNPGATPVGLFDPAFPTNRWRIAGIEFVFPAGFTLAAHQRALVVKDDPAQFRLRHSVASDVPVLGPYPGSLQDNGEEIELQAPAGPLSAGVPYYAVDQVRYHDAAPWPRSADGSGASLHRLSPDAYGSEPAHWAAALPSPGDPWQAGPAPVILHDPVDTVAIAGQSAVFQVGVGGTGPFALQWRVNGRRIADATNATLVLQPVSLADAGAYTADVINAHGTVTSAPARLGVLLPPRILQQPAGLYVRPGSNVVLTVVADSTTALAYQWQHNGVDMAGEQQPTLVINNAGVADQGVYQVRITDAVASVWSDAVTLALLIDPVIVQDPVGGVAVPGGSMTFSVQVTNTATLPITYRWKRGTSELPGGVFTLNGRVSFMTVTNLQTTGTNISVTVSNISRKTVLVSKVASVLLLPDVDKDGIPDLLEQQWGLDPSTAADASLDADGDGMTNLGEFVAGTDPRDPKSRLELRWLADGQGGGAFEFQAVSNRTYTVEVTDSLLPPGWRPLMDFVALPVTHTERFIDPGAASGTNHFYRVQTPRRR